MGNAYTISDNYTIEARNTTMFTTYFGKPSESFDIYESVLSTDHIIGSRAIVTVIVRSVCLWFCLSVWHRENVCNVGQYCGTKML